MTNRENISMSVVRRMPRYYRFLTDLSRSGKSRISSKELATLMGLTASQIRQDLNCFGGFGQQGYGYDIEKLRSEIGSIIGLSNNYHAIMLGAGNLGRSLSYYLTEKPRGFDLRAIFDISPELIGTQINGVAIRDIAGLEDYCDSSTPQAAFLCIPRPAVEHEVDRLYAKGVRCFWNFSHYDISLKYEDAVVENVHLGDSLMTLCYRITN